MRCEHLSCRFIVVKPHDYGVEKEREFLFCFFGGGCFVILGQAQLNSPIEESVQMTRKSKKMIQGFHHCFSAIIKIKGQNEITS